MPPRNVYMPSALATPSRHPKPSSPSHTNMGNTTSKTPSSAPTPPVAAPRCFPPFQISNAVFEQLKHLQLEVDEARALLIAQLRLYNAMQRRFDEDMNQVYDGHLAERAKAYSPRYREILDAQFEEYYAQLWVELEEPILVARERTEELQDQLLEVEVQLYGPEGVVKTLSKSEVDERFLRKKMMEKWEYEEWRGRTVNGCMGAGCCDTCERSA
jgi:cell division septation protein DedD